MLGTLLSKGKTLSEARTEGQRNSYMGELTFHAKKKKLHVTSPQQTEVHVLALALQVLSKTR